jgi:hypothetical protein
LGDSLEIDGQFVESPAHTAIGARIVASAT